MPVYEYACKACGHHLEVSQSFKDEPLTECPVCGGPLRKVFHPIGVVLKGSGFYRTDSRMPSKKAGVAAEGKGDGKSGEGKSGEGKGSESKASGESKSDPKSESKSKSEGKSEAKSAGSSTTKSA